MPNDTRPIALLDSGVGGLSTLNEVRQLLPHENLLYFADRANVPYGPRPLSEIGMIVEGIARFLLSQDAKAIVVACNAASAGGLLHLRETFPGVPIVGMEPAVKPAAENTQTGTIGVITTQATFQGELFRSVIGRFADGVNVETQVCPEFVTMVEAGQINGDASRQTVRARLRPLLEAQIDQLVLGCTHFPFLTPLLEEEAGPGVTIVDPGPAVARQTARVTKTMSNEQAIGGQVTYYTSGDLPAFEDVAARLLGHAPQDAHAARWQPGYHLTG